MTAVVLAANSADIIASEAANRKHLLQDYASYDGENQAAKDRDVDRLVDEEEREEGRVSKEQFSNYLDSLGGMKVYIFLIVVQTLWHVSGPVTDADIWSALEKVGMKAQVSALERQLTYELSENFSVVEQQMLVRC
uniref:Uncharacterized protein n=1 Tax=Phytophthora ramorum TaxID=164328 RepID=H3GXS2_PHYRM